MTANEHQKALLLATLPTCAIANNTRNRITREGVLSLRQTSTGKTAANSTATRSRIPMMPVSTAVSTKRL